MADDGGQEARGKAFVLQAEERLKGGFFERLMGDPKQRNQDAADLLQKAANCFKLAKKLDLAADAFSKAAECSLRADSKHDAATAYSNASQALRKINTAESVQYLQKSTDIYLDEGRFSIAAKNMKDIAEIYEAEGVIDKPMEYYNKTVDLYEGENSTANANSAKLKVAHFHGQLDQFEQGAELFEKIAEANVDNRLTNYSVSDYLFKAALCRLAMQDIVGTRRALERYSSIHFKWNNSNEQKFVAELFSACENYDQDAFTHAVQEFDSIYRLDQWKTSMLFKIKNGIQNPDSEIT
jgi:alpha-soluble NSF attachment protein